MLKSSILVFTGLCCFSCCTAQKIQYFEFSLISGLRVQPKTSLAKTTAAILGFEKRVNIENTKTFKIQLISIYINTSQNLSDWKSNRIGSKFLIYRDLNYLPIYVVSNVHVNFQNDFQKKNQNFGLANICLGAGYQISKNAQIEITFGVSEYQSHKPPYFEVVCNRTFILSKKIKRKHLTKCPD